MKYYSALEKKNDVLHFATTWVDLEGIMLSEISQMEKDKCHMISFEYGILNKQKNEKRKLNKTNLKIQRSDDWLSEGKGNGALGKTGEGGQLYGDRW